MSKRTEKVGKVLSEGALMRDANKKQQQKLYKTIKAAGGDIGMKVRKDEHSKEDKMPNAIYMDNPWGSSRHIDTYENFQMKEEERLVEAGLPTAKTAKQMKKLNKKAKKGGSDIGDKTKSKATKDPLSNKALISTNEDFNFIPTTLEDFYMWKDRKKINQNNDNWIKGTKEDFQRPMFKNLPDHKDRYPYDVLRDGKFIETKDGKIVGQINKLKDNVIVLDIIDEDFKHQYVEFDLVKLIKKIKDEELTITSNSTSKNIKIDTPWGTKFTIKDNK